MIGQMFYTACTPKLPSASFSPTVCFALLTPKNPGTLCNSVHVAPFIIRQLSFRWQAFPRYLSMPASNLCTTNSKSPGFRAPASAFE